VRWSGAQILDWPARLLSKCDSSVKRPIGVPEHFASEKDHVSLTGGDNFVGLPGVGNHADGGGRDIGFGANASRERHLKARAKGDAGIWHLTA